MPVDNQVAEGAQKNRCKGTQRPPSAESPSRAKRVRIPLEVGGNEDIQHLV